MIIHVFRTSHTELHGILVVNISLPNQCKRILIYHRVVLVHALVQYLDAHYVFDAFSIQESSQSSALPYALDACEDEQI